MLLAMTKVEVIGPKKYFYDVVGLLHQLGTLHIEDMSKRLTVGDMTLRRMSVDDETERLKTNLENLIIRVNGIIQTIKPESAIDEATERRYYHEYWRENGNELKESVNGLIMQLEDKTRDLATRKSQLELELTSMQRYETIVAKIQPLAKQMIALEGFETVAFLIESKYKSVLDLIHQEMSRLTKDQFEIVSADVDENTTAALAVFNKKYSQPVHAFLSDNVNEVRLPEALADEPFDVALVKIKQQRQDIPKELERIKEQLSALSLEWFERLSAVSAVLRDRIEELTCVPQFAQTDYTFVITGWLPRKYVKRTNEAVRAQFGERVIVSEMALSPHELEEAPILAENPSWAKPFEMILKIVAQPPRYGTIDPTPFVAVFFPTFFGLILGDMGYGLLIFLVSLIIRRKFKENAIAQNVTAIFMIAGISTFFFGMVFGEFFGDWPHRLHLVREIKFSIWPNVLPYERTKGELMLGLLYVCLGLGTAHLVLGLVLGLINAIREHSRKHAFEKIGFMVLIAGLLVIIVTLGKQIGMNAGIAIMVAGIALAIYGAGFLGTLEHLFGLFGNIFSYARLMALGLAGAILALVANELVGALGIALGVLIAVLLHSINLLVGAFSPSIHSIRLNVIEFFGKFYEGGGNEYKPFKVEKLFEARGKEQ